MMSDRIIEVAFDAANDIADDFAVGFCDDRMVEFFAAHIERHTTQLVESIVKECMITIQNGIPRGVSSPENIQSWNHIADIADKFNITLPLETK
jgi:hypothetical protein